MRAEFQRIRELFVKPGYLFRVPEYQRGFEWDKKNFEDLWADLNRIGGRVDKHFLGNIILLEADNNAYEIVDGQQRIATISILLIAIRDQKGIEAEDDRRIDDILNCHPEGNKERRLHLHDEDSDKYYEHLWEGETNDIDGNIADAYDFYMRQLEDKDDSELDNIITKITDQLRVVETVSRDSSLAYMIFQSQNERGVEVSPEVLIKARIFGEADREDDPRRRQEIEGRWREMYRMFEEELGRPRFQKSHLIRRPLTHILLNSEVRTPTEIDSGALYRNFDTVLQNYDDVYEFVKWYDEQAKEYMQLASSDYDISKRGISWRTRRYLEYFNAASTNAEVLSLAIFNRVDEDDERLTEYFRLAATLPMRMELAGYRSQDRKTAVHEASRRIRRGEEIRSVLEDIIQKEGPSDGEIIETLRAEPPTLNGPWRFRTLLQLVSIEESRRGPLRVELENLDIEHVAPRRTFSNNTYSRWRRMLTESEFEEEKNKLGNLTLLDERDHAGIDETTFENKRRSYANSDLSLAEEIADYDSWSVTEIKERTNRLARELTDKWSI